mmetsp:Transcript_2100/g.5544  ORF Transcript_2100/g.5544 Transcript_2100/m.5544 type:complete len:304 (-) Transcript_2100:276-1187(-)
MTAHFSVASLALLLVCPAFPTAAGDGTGCYETCSSGIDTGAVARCLASPADAAMPNVYDAVVDLNLASGADGDEGRVLAGLNALSAQAGRAFTAEGLSFCLPGDAFYWNPDCNVAAVLCRNRTAEEMELGNIGYIVDAAYHDDDLFHRYAFNATTMVETAYQSPTLSSGYQCTALPWYKTGMCAGESGLPITCPEETAGSPNPFYNGWSANQYYGDVGAVVIGQQLRNANLAPCMEELDEGDTVEEVEDAEMGVNDTDVNTEAKGSQMEVDGDGDATRHSSIATSVVSGELLKVFLCLLIAYL